MRKLRLIKVVVPELVSYAMYSNGEKIPDYRCPECRLGAYENYRYCGTCGSEFDWSKAESVGGMTAKVCAKLGKHVSKGIAEGLSHTMGVNSPSKWD